MAKNIDPKLKKIGEYLKLDAGSIFSIPEYQRPYSWRIYDCDKLWQDIIAFIDSDGNDPYFFGTIIINCLENDKVLSLIDGQQRTTTFLLLLKALLINLIKSVEETSKDSDSEALAEGLKAKRNVIMKILYKAEDEEIFAILKNFGKVADVVILENKSINELFKDEAGKIFIAPDFEIAEYSVHKIPRKQKDNKYTAHFRNFKFFYEKFQDMNPSQINTFAKVFLEKCEVIEIRSWNVDQAITMFNSLNSDGMPLSDADIISAKLYSQARDNRDEFETKWASLYNKVSQLEQSRIADIDAVLMQYMYIHRARGKEYISDKGSVDVTTPGLRRYYTEIKNKELLNNPIALCDELLKIADIWLNIKDFPIIKLALKFNDNIKLYLAGYLSRFEAEDITEDNVKKISICLVKLFAVLELVDIGYSSNKFKTFLFGENIKLVDATVDITEIERDFSEHISSTWKLDDVKKEILEYDKNILVFLNEYLFAQSRDLEFVLTEKYDIEHIMPASGKAIALIRADAGIEDDDEFALVVNKLGNKILLEESINRAIGNEWFRAKIQTSVNDKSGYKDSVYSIASDLVTTYTAIPKPYWMKNDIINVTDKIAQRIIKFLF